MHVVRRADHLEFDDDPMLDGTEPALAHLAGKGISESFATDP
jgi:hypothetical protein